MCKQKNLHLDKFRQESAWLFQKRIPQSTHPMSPSKKKNEIHLECQGVEFGKLR